MNPAPDNILPAPDGESLAHSERLRRVIVDRIEAGGGVIDFSDFMQLALYAPELGYYVAGRRLFGEHGDFITAPEIGDIFARCLARQCAQVLTAIEPGEIMEFGAGSGALAADMLLELERLQQLPGCYRILEVSPVLAALQRDTIRARAPQHLSRVEWLTALPAAGFDGVILANEVLDALPVQRVLIRDRAPHCIEVGRRDADLVELARAEPQPELDFIIRLSLADGYRTEVGLQSTAWVRSVADCLHRGLILIIDYGFPRDEYYHPQRSDGTLMCHYRHRAHSDPYIHIGLQDITAHIDFTALAIAGRESGLTLDGYTSQAGFLLAAGITDIIAPMMSASTEQQLAITQQVKRLTLPTAMGELFKVMALTRNLDIPLAGFTHADHRGRL